MIRKALQNRYMVTVLAVIGLAAVGIQLYRALPKKVRPPTSLKPTQTLNAPPVSATGMQEVAPMDISKVQWGDRLDRNPFQPAKTLLETAGAAAEKPQKAAVTPPRLNAISIQESSRLAILDGRVVGEGDMLQQWKVLSILPDKVVIKDARGETNVLFKGLSKEADSSRPTTSRGENPQIDP